MSEPQQHAPAAGWGTIVLVYSLCVLAASSISQAVPIVGDLVRAFQAHGQQIGWVISIPSAVVALGALLTGWIADRVGDKPLMLVGTALLILGDVGVTLAGSMNQLLAMRVLEGLGYDCVAVSTVTMISRVTTGSRRTTALTLWSSFVPMSFAIPLIMAGLLAGTGHWRWAFGGHAIIMFIVGLAAFSLPGRTETVATGAPVAGRSRGMSLVLRTPAVYALGIAFACAAFVQTGIVSTLPQMLQGRFGLSVELASSIGTAGMVCNIVGCLLMGPLLNRGYSPLWLAIGSVLLAVLSASGLYAAGVSIGATVVLALLFFVGSGLVVGLWALLPVVAPTRDSRGATSGLVTQLTLWGVLFGPPGAFAAQAAGGDRQTINVVVALLLCALLLWVVVRLCAPRLTAIEAGASH